MKKCEFYSVHIEKGKKIAKLHSGYTDGTYNYYKAGFTWCAIVPDTGLAAVNDKTTRSDTAQRAHSIEITDRIARIPAERIAERRTEFEKLVREAQEREIENAGDAR